MSSHISDLLPDMIYYQLNEFIEEKETKIKKFKEAYQEFTLADMSKAEKELKHIPKYKAMEGIQELIEQIKKGQL
jgi:nucleoside-diphosphate-sugar epimerase